MLDMKKLFLILAIIALPFEGTVAQSFQNALELYETEQYEEAIELFKELDTDQAQLFTGKSYLALGNYPLAIHYLKQSGESSRQNIQQESQYSMALARFRTKNYAGSLNLLSNLLDSDNRTGIQLDARRLYNQILTYLDIGERFEVMQLAERPSLRLDLVQNSRRQLDEPLYRSLVNELLRLEPDPSLHRELTENLDNSRNSSLSTVSMYPNAPQGTVYHVGVVLPTFDEDDPDFTIPRNLYYGMMLAADEFNSRNSDKKIQLIFKNSAEDKDSTAVAVTELAWAHYADAVIGPLFSEPARRMAELTEEYRIPMLAPLANSDELNLDYNYTYQLNPTFEVHGTMMARFAVNELQLDSLAVITDSESVGRRAALSFRREAERLGAHISHFIEDDFATRGYDLSEYTEVFSTDEALIDSLGYTPSQAVYAPFTGQASSTLINLLMNDLEAMRSRPVILGTEDWANADLSAYQRRVFEVYHTQSDGAAADSSALAYFEEDFQTRFDIQPDRFARIGYDTANYLFKSLELAGNPAYLGNVLRSSELYNGVGRQIYFDGNRVNQQVYFRALTPGAEERRQE